MKKSPFNVRILNPDEYIPIRNCLPVTSFAMYESSTTNFHPDGLFSEVIFGQVGSSSRLIRRGYIDLRTEVITPHLFKQIISMKKTLYTGIMKGDTYAVFDNTLKDFVKTTINDPKANTGFQFFMENIKKVKFAYTDSVQRANKIKLIDKYRDEMFINKYIVLPAGVRDVRIKNGRPSSEAINKLYLALLSETEALPDANTVDPLFDPIRYRIQLKLVEIYDYIDNLMSGKKGFASGKYAARDVVYSNRNVITAALMNNAPSADSKRVFSIDEVEVPLFQAMKGAVPLIANKMLNSFFDQVFSIDQNEAYLINTKTLDLELSHIEDDELRKFTSFDGMEKIIDDFRNREIQFSPVKIKTTTENGKVEYKYLSLVYDDGINIHLFRNKYDFEQQFAHPEKYTDDLKALSILDNLNLDPEDYIIEGSCACYAQGMDIDPTDMDIIPNHKACTILSELPDKQEDKFGDFTVVVSGIELHVKRNLFKITDDKSFDKFKSTSSITIGKHSYLKASVLLARYQELNRITDKRKIEFLKSRVFDPTNVRPITYAEMCYLSTYFALRDKHATATRYPVLNLQNLVVYKIHLMSTAVSREVRLFMGSTLTYETLPEYPRLDSPVRAAMSLHPATLALYGADHDGMTPKYNIGIVLPSNRFR